MAGRYQEIFAPDMTVEKPVYHFTMLGKTLTLEGAEAVKAVYHEWSESAQCIFYAKDEKLAVSDHMIVSTSLIYQQTPGHVLAADGVAADPNELPGEDGRAHDLAVRRPGPADRRGRLGVRRDGARDHPVAPGRRP